MNKIRVLRKSDGLYYGVCFGGERTNGFLSPKRARHVAAKLTLNDKRLYMFRRIEFRERKNRCQRLKGRVVWQSQSST